MDFSFAIFFLNKEVSDLDLGAIVIDFVFARFILVRWEKGHKRRHFVREKRRVKDHLKMTLTAQSEYIKRN